VGFVSHEIGMHGTKWEHKFEHQGSGIQFKVIFLIESAPTDSFAMIDGMV